MKTQEGEGRGWHLRPGAMLAQGKHRRCTCLWNAARGKDGSSNACSKPSSYRPRGRRYLHVSIDPSFSAVTEMPWHICWARSLLQQTPLPSHRRPGTPPRGDFPEERGKEGPREEKRWAWAIFFNESFSPPLRHGGFTSTARSVTPSREAQPGNRC